MTNPTSESKSDSTSFPVNSDTSSTNQSPDVLLAMAKNMTEALDVSDGGSTSSSPSSDTPPPTPIVQPPSYAINQFMNQQFGNLYTTLQIGYIVSLMSSRVDRLTGSVPSENVSSFQNALLALGATSQELNMLLALNHQDLFEGLSDYNIGNLSSLKNLMTETLADMVKSSNPTPETSVFLKNIQRIMDENEALSSSEPLAPDVVLRSLAQLMKKIGEAFDDYQQVLDELDAALSQPVKEQKIAQDRQKEQFLKNEEIENANLNKEQDNQIPTDLKEAILAIGRAINKMLELLLEDIATHGKIISANNEALLLKCQADMKNLLDKIAEQERAEAEARKWGKIGKILGITSAVIFSVLAAATLQPELFVLAGVAIVYATEAGQKINKASESLFTWTGNDAAAKILGAVLIAVVVALLCCGAGSFTVSEQAAQTGAASGTSSAASSAAEGSNQSAVESGVQASSASASQSQLSNSQIANEAAAQSNLAASQVSEKSSKSAQYMKLAKIGAANGAVLGGMPEGLTTMIIPGQDRDKWYAISLTVVLSLLITLAGGSGNAEGSLAAPKAGGAGKPVQGASEAGAEGNSSFLNQPSTYARAQGLEKIAEGVSSTSFKVLKQVLTQTLHILHIVVKAEQMRAAENVSRVLEERAPLDEQTVILKSLKDLLQRSWQSIQSDEQRGVQQLNSLLPDLNKLFGSMRGTDQVLKG
ncbi:MAG: hypothetical protein ACOVOR_01940 [Rhabdochlamydiaceae bacterium]